MRGRVHVCVPGGMRWKVGDGRGFPEGVPGGPGAPMQTRMGGNREGVQSVKHAHVRGWEGGRNCPDLLDMPALHTPLESIPVTRPFPYPCSTRAHTHTHTDTHTP